MTALPHQASDANVKGGMPRRGRDGGSGIFERGDPFLENADGRIRYPRINVSRRFQVVERGRRREREATT